MATWTVGLETVDGEEIVNLEVPEALSRDEAHELIREVSHLLA